MIHEYSVRLLRACCLPARKKVLTCENGERHSDRSWQAVAFLPSLASPASFCFIGLHITQV